MNNRARVISLSRLRPDWTMTHIGLHLGISRERVRQICKSEKILHGRAKLEYLRVALSPTCPECGDPIVRYRAVFCSNLCRYNASHPKFICIECGKEFRRRRSVTLRNKVGCFCNKRCFGRYAGKHYGLGSPQVKAKIRRNVEAQRKKRMGLK